MDAIHHALNLITEIRRLEGQRSIQFKTNVESFQRIASIKRELLGMLTAFKDYQDFVCSNDFGRMVHDADYGACHEIPKFVADARLNLSSIITQINKVLYSSGEKSSSGRKRR